MQDKKFSTLWAILFMVGSSSIIRSFLEFFSNPEYNQSFSPWYVTLNYFLCFLSIIIALGFIIGKTVGESSTKWIYIFSKYSPIIFLAPLFDLLLSKGDGYCMSYLGSGGYLIIRDFLTLGGPYTGCGVSPGMRIEILIVLLFIIRIIWKKTKSHFKTLLGTLIAYTALFIAGDIPALVGTIGGSGIRAGAWLLQEVQSSTLFSIDKLNQFLNPNEYYTYIVSLFMGQIHYITIVLLGLVIWFQNKHSEFIQWMKNGRWERYGYYSLLFFVGIFLVIHNNPDQVFNWVDGVGIITALIAILTNGWAAAVWNDFTDKEIDAASNSDRPLHTHVLNSDGYRMYGILFFATGMIGALLVNYSFFLCLVLFQVLYGMYSFSGTRWKKYFFLSAPTIGLVGIIMILAGYFFADKGQNFAQFPFLFILLAFVTLTITSQAKDFKDIAGDRIGGIKTLPVLLGARRASLILTGVLSLWIICLGFITHNLIIGLQAIPWIVLDLIWRKKIPEYVRFLILFAQIIGLILYFA